MRERDQKEQGGWLGGQAEGLFVDYMEHTVMVVMSRHLIIHLDHLHLRNIRPIR